jgi:hypothetical protein
MKAIQKYLRGACGLKLSTSPAGRGNRMSYVFRSGSRNASILRVAALGVGAIVVSLALTQAVSAQNPPYDLVLRNARFMDSSGSGAYRGDVAILGDTTASIAPAIEGPGQVLYGPAKGQPKS